MNTPIELQSEKASDRLKEITDRLEQGVTELFDSDRYKEYLRVMARFHRYSFNNTLLIAMQCPDATKLAPFQIWKTLGRHVRKGEKGIKIIVPTPYKKVIEDNGEEKEVLVPFFKVGSTYDLSQTEGKLLPDILRPLPGRIKRYDVFMAALEKVSPIPISFEDISGDTHGYYSPTDKRIVIQEGMSEQQAVKTLIREISHAKLHDYDLKGLRNKHLGIDRHTMEVQAESIAFVCCERFGLDNSGYSFGYIAGWSSGRDLKELRSSLKIIRNTAAEIIDGIDEHLLNLWQEDEMSSPVLEM